MHTDNAYSIGKKCEKLKELIPDSNLIFVQAAIGVKVIS
jgi:translation elongation factor EF-4